MKHLVSVLLLAWLCMACGNTNETTQESVTAPDSVVQAPVAPTLLSRFSNRMQQLVSKETGLLRGFIPGESLDSVMRNETAVLHEDSTRYKGYFLGDSLSTDVLDIRYFFNPKSRLTDSLVIDTYSEPDSLMRELSDYFSVRFGEPVLKTQKVISWQNADSQVIVRDVSVKLSPGLQVVARKYRNK